MFMIVWTAYKEIMWNDGACGPFYTFKEMGQFWNILLIITIFQISILMHIYIFIYIHNGACMQFSIIDILFKQRLNDCRSCLFLFLIYIFVC